MNVITSQSTLIGIASNGALDSTLLQSFTDNTVTDIQNITKAVNEHTNELNNTNKAVLNEVDTIRTSIRNIENNQISLLKAEKEYVHIIDFFSKKNIEYATETPDTNKLIVDYKYGQTYLPALDYSPVFYSEDNDGNISEITNLQFSVTPDSEPVVAGFSQSVDTTEPRRAVNGQNSEAWVRTVTYPLEAPVSEVIATYEIYLNATDASKRFNMVKINPFPTERVDILGVWYKTTSISPWVLLEEFPSAGINNADHIQYIGQTRNIFAAKIQIRQRNYSDNNNKKTFTYGLQEFDFKYVEFSKQNSTYDLTDLTLNNHTIVKVQAPMGTTFNRLIGFDSNPIANLEGSANNNNHIIFIISKAISLANADVIWRSNSDILPQVSSKALGIDTYYIIILMKYVANISAPLSPFNAQTTPVVSNITVTHDLVNTAGPVVPAVTADDINSSAWDIRNWAIHKTFVSHMDVYRTVVDDGSNIFIMGDDFWSGYTHRDVLNGVAIDHKLMSLITSSPAPSFVGDITYKTMITSAGVGGIIPFVPRRFRIQSVHDTPGNSTVTFKFNYTANSSPASEIAVLAKDKNVIWYNLVGDMSDFSLSIYMQNSSLGDQPILGQFVLIFKD